jgi:hypothetical protein
MQLAIYESEHFSTAYALIRLFDLPGNTITIFTNEATSERLHEMLASRASSYQWVLQQGNESNRQFIRKMYTSIKLSNPDVFIFGTLSHNYLLHALLMRTSPVQRFLLTVHEVNSLFRSRLRWGIRKTGNFIGKKLLTRSVKEYVSILETLLPAIRDCVPPDKKIHSLSGAVFEGDHTNTPIQQPIKIVVPGTIEQSRRDYKQVIGLLDAAKAIGLQLEITLSGTAKEQIQQQGIITHNGTVSQPEFDRQMREAHFIFAPVVLNTISPDGVPEIYGPTKVSGNVLDIIRFAKPAFVPRHLALPTNLEPACISYGSVDEIVMHLKKIIDDPAIYAALQHSALESSQNYTVEKIRAANPELFN